MSNRIPNIKRPRRLRTSPALRALVQENALAVTELVQPVFVKEGLVAPEPIQSLPGIQQHTIASLQAYAKQIYTRGIPAIALFPAIDDAKKNSSATEAIRANSFYIQCIRAVKQAVPDIVVISDIALDPYSSDGHDGLVKEGVILNDETVAILSQMAVHHAAAGADMVAPSDMMDGRIAAIRAHLDSAGYTQTAILSYCAKFSSAFYSPFRDALNSAPKQGDKKTYQLNPANAKEALRQLDLDDAAGADVLMVKPASMYLDIIWQFHQRTLLPIAAYHVSGEYAMLHAAAAAGYCCYQEATLEKLLGMKRAGASFIFTYAACDVAEWLQQ